jgi:hypothetical protein
MAYPHTLPNRPTPLAAGHPKFLVQISSPLVHSVDARIGVTLALPVVCCPAVSKAPQASDSKSNAAGLGGRGLSQVPSPYPAEPEAKLDASNSTGVSPYAAQPPAAPLQEYTQLGRWLCCQCRTASLTPAQCISKHNARLPGH